MKNTNKLAYIRMGNTIIVCKLNRPCKPKFRTRKLDIRRV